DGVSRLERADATGEIDIVRDQHRLPGRQANDEALMATAFIVVRQDFGDAASALNLNVAAMILERRRQRVGSTSGTGDSPIIVMLRRQQSAVRGEIHGRESNRNDDDSLHCPRFLLSTDRSIVRTPTV